ncbi:4Fe-4S dicluster domain-containing protein [Thermosulfuriphilus sp.]
MAKYYIYHDPSRCIGCLSCELSCNDWKGLPYGQSNCRIFQYGPEMEDGQPVLGFAYVSCFHCERPFCVEACPSAALSKRDTDGTVFFREDRCIGCRACLTACPWGIPQWNAVKGRIHKCDYCLERIDRGLEPACVARCPTRALRFMTSQEAAYLKRARWLEETFGHHVRPVGERL